MLQSKSMYFKMIEYHLKRITEIYKYSNVSDQHYRNLRPTLQLKSMLKILNKLKCLYYTFLFYIVFYLQNKRKQIIKFFMRHEIS